MLDQMFTGENFREIFDVENRKGNDLAARFFPALEPHTAAKAHCRNDAEALMLLLDLIVCPYVSSQTKVAMAAAFDLDAAALVDVQRANDFWFTVWGDGFSLGKELDAKRSREVY